jgi:cell wall-associated NlpC family hydrolase
MNASIGNLIRYAWKLVGTPYIWGGDDPLKGFDCSGLVVELLKSVGMISEIDDYTADGLLRKYLNNTVKKIGNPGQLIFRTNDEETAFHVAVIVDKTTIIHASGAGLSCKNIQDAIDKNAYVKPRNLREFMIDYPSVIVLDPWNRG